MLAQNTLPITWNKSENVEEFNTSNMANVDDANRTSGISTVDKTNM